MKKSAGILMFKKEAGLLKIFLMHPGGPFWSKKDLAAWSIPKGEINENELEEEAAVREFHEETGMSVKGRMVPLQPVKQKSGKIVLAWAVEQDLDITQVKSNLFEMEWPPKSGKIQSFPEMDRAEWFPVNEAKKKIIPGQILLIEQLEALYRQHVI